jgi:hypothetical protein
MRVRTPEPFTIAVVGPQGPYTLAFHRHSDWDGYLDVALQGVEMRWAIEAIYDEDGDTYFCGGTDVGTIKLWGDMFWFRLFPSGNDPRVELWGAGVIVRIDRPPI